jgi:hypothetical protein
LNTTIPSCSAIGRRESWHQAVVATRERPTAQRLAALPGRASRRRLEKNAIATAASTSEKFSMIPSGESQASAAAWC